MVLKPCKKGAVERVKKFCGVMPGVGCGAHMVVGPAVAMGLWAAACSVLRVQLRPWFSHVAGLPTTLARVVKTEAGV